MTVFYLGMAKSSVNLKGAKAQKLELDLLRLIYLIKTRNNHKDERIIGFLMVSNEKIKKRCELWIEKYDSTDLLEKKVLSIDFFEGTKEEMESILIEKERNKKAITGGNIDYAKADYSKKLIEGALHKFMANSINNKDSKKVLNSIQIKKDIDNLKFGIRWDGCFISHPKTH